MASNPLVTQGTLNRLIGSLQFAQNATLNVTAGFLGKEGISIDPEGDASLAIPTMTGIVQSGEPYRIARVSVALLKTQGLAAAWKTQEQTNTQLGDCTLRIDTNAIGSFPLSNCGLMGFRTLNSAGTDAKYSISFYGIYYINSALWDLLG